MSDEPTESPLELISQLTELNDISEYMQDEQLDRAIHLLIKILMERGALPQSNIARIIVELQALATVFAFKATYYMTIGKGGSEEAKRKNIYYTAKEAITKLVDSMKYIAKS